MTERLSSVFIHKLTPKNILSFGPDFPGIELKALNVLIGPNGCGKSNLIEVINFMRHAPRDWEEFLRRGGRASEWTWKGAQLFDFASVGLVSRANKYAPLSKSGVLVHEVEFPASEDGFWITDETLTLRPAEGSKEPSEKILYSLKSQKRGKAQRDEQESEAPIESTLRRLSALNWGASPLGSDALFALASKYNGIRIFSSWAFGREGTGRGNQPSDLPKQELLEDFTNLNLVLNRIKTRSRAAAQKILHCLQDIYAGIDDFNIEVNPGSVQLFFNEGDFVIPASRLSDGTLRYLCLLTILLDPEPPPLVCIEEPELGLHPDLIPKVADLLVEASKRMQLVVTTHSETLIDALTETPESIIVCSKVDGQTQMERLKAEDLKVWLDKYRLGELWSRGGIGGNRW